jgi:cell wall-associated NlpC family hydrolase
MVDPQWYRDLQGAPPAGGSPVGAAAPPPAPPAGVGPVWGPGAGGGETPEQTIRRVAGTYNFADPDLLIATARQESSLNPLAVGDQGQSYGVFQEHSKGRGAGIPVQSRQDVAAATERAIREFNAIRQRNPAVDRGTWAALAQRPLDAAGYARSVNALLGGAAPSVATSGPAGSPTTGASPTPPAAAADGAAPDWYRDLVERPGSRVERQTLPEAPVAQGAEPPWYRELLGSRTGTGPAPVTQATGVAPVGGPPAGAGASANAVGKQAVAAAWALSNLGSQAYRDLCQRFIEQAYGTSGRYRSAAAASNALMKTADPAEADVGDLVFFRPDASNGGAGHVGIYLGNGEMVSATNAGVTRDNIYGSPYWRNLLVGFGDPPDQWGGRASNAELAKGADRLISTARAAAGGTSGGATSASGPAPAWYSELVGRGT